MYSIVDTVNSAVLYVWQQYKSQSWKLSSEKKSLTT